MNEILEIHVAMEKVIVDLKRLNYADYTIGRYRHCFDGMLRFIEGSGISFYSDELAAEYIKFKFLESFLWVFLRDIHPMSALLFVHCEPFLDIQY